MLAGATRSKAAYRVAGTLLGAVVTVILVPNLVNAPELLVLAIAFWVSVCLYFSLLDRTPRSYMLMLGGYTAALIGFPAVGEPGAIFDTAVGARRKSPWHCLREPCLVDRAAPLGRDGDRRPARRWIREARVWIVDVLSRFRHGEGHSIEATAPRLRRDRARRPRHAAAVRPLGRGASRGWRLPRCASIC